MNDHLIFKANLAYFFGTCQGLLICLSPEALKRSLCSFVSIEGAVIFDWLSFRRA